ncbi:hypothetical protein TNIN_423121 [Trichonephila inaurata madagascariensis]|uniref:Uncharacterized protein n=1 Tax=Trichonephila inaurata madagascariensis TaxID=2747483 RepID=A0A8X6ME52_9ARAC|nr:hypothetical protein TNIN_423121 [Trichonephila inaurata madagascariensis]
MAFRPRKPVIPFDLGDDDVYFFCWLASVRHPTSSVQDSTNFTSTITGLKLPGGGEVCLCAVAVNAGQCKHFKKPCYGFETCKNHGWWGSKNWISWKGRTFLLGHLASTGATYCPKWAFSECAKGHRTMQWGPILQGPPQGCHRFRATKKSQFQTSDDCHEALAFHIELRNSQAQKGSGQLSYFIVVIFPLLALLLNFILKQYQQQEPS